MATWPQVRLVRFVPTHVHLYAALTCRSTIANLPGADRFGQRVPLSSRARSFFCAALAEYATRGIPKEATPFFDCAWGCGSQLLDSLTPLYNILHPPLPAYACLSRGVCAHSAKYACNYVAMDHSMPGFPDTKNFAD